MSVRTRIIGIGNPLRGDDGVGVVLAERLAKSGLPAHVEVLDGGLGGLALLDAFESVERVILLDAADFGALPGMTALLDLQGAPLEDDPSLSDLHAGLVPLLALVRQLELCPDVLLVAIQVRDVAPGLGLSPEVSESLPALEAAILALVI